MSFEFPEQLNPKQEKGPEKILDKNEVMQEMLRFSEKPVLERELFDENGLLYLLEVSIKGKNPGESTHYEYMRKGIYPNGNRSSETRIEAHYYEDDMLTGGDTIVVYKNDAWELHKKKDQKNTVHEQPKQYDPIIPWDIEKSSSQENFENLNKLFDEGEGVFTVEGREKAKENLNLINFILNRLENKSDNLSEGDIDVLNRRRAKLSNALGMIMETGDVRHDLNNTFE